MKKFMIALAFASIGLAASAQTQIETPSKYTVATNSFWSNWFVQVGVDMTLQAPYGCNFLGDAFHDGQSYGIQIAVGKWFTPGLGLRVKANWENGAIEVDHNKWIYGIGEDGYSTNYDAGGYGAIYGDVMFNLSNLFYGYSDTRVWNLVPFLRAGVVRNFDMNTYAPVLGGGLHSSWRFAQNWNVFAEIAYNAVTDDFYAESHRNMEGVDVSAYVDINIGVTWMLGEATFKKAVSLDAYNALQAKSEEELARLRADLDRERQINADLRAELAKKPKEQPAPEPKTIIASAATSVFFELNSSKINSQKDIINLEAVASAAKDSGAKVVITGSADSKTGSAAWNQTLSENRANAVADELVNLGVSRDNIEVKAIGGVDEVSPYPLNRRAVVELK